jgi:putative Mn2+ efflux pump MntP
MIMSTPAIIISILFILCLTSSVVTRSVGLVKADDKPSQKIWIPVIFGLSQGIMALAGFSLSRLMAHLFTYIAEYMVFAMMLVVAVKLFVDSMRTLKGKTMYTLRSDKDMMLLSLLAAFNAFLYGLVGAFFLPFGIWFFVVVALAGFLWSFFTVRVDFSPGIIKKASFVEFSASVFMVVIAILYLFTDVIGN